MLEGVIGFTFAHSQAHGKGQVAKASPSNYCEVTLKSLGGGTLSFANRDRWLRTSVYLLLWYSEWPVAQRMSTLGEGNGQWR